MKLRVDDSLLALLGLASFLTPALTLVVLTLIAFVLATFLVFLAMGVIEF